MVYQYKNNGYNMVLDVESGSVHVVDDLSYDVVRLYGTHTLKEIQKNFPDTMPGRSRKSMRKSGVWRAKGHSLQGTSMRIT